MSRHRNTPARARGEAPGLPAKVTASIAAVHTAIDRMENGLHKVRDLAHAIFIIAEAMPWDEAKAVQRVAGFIMDRADELKRQQIAAFDTLCKLTAGEREASHG